MRFLGDLPAWDQVMRGVPEKIPTIERETVGGQLMALHAQDMVALAEVAMAEGRRFDPGPGHSIASLDWAAVHPASLQRTAAIVVAVAVFIASTGLPSAAAASDKLLLGGGAGIRLNGDTLCTLTAIGSDTADRLIGFTAAHCGGAGSTVVADGAEDEGIVGTVVAADDGLDYAVIEFDPAKVAGIRNYEGFAIKGVDPDADHAQRACKLGRATGVSCWDSGSGALDPEGNEWWQPGDDGAPVTVDDLIVGMVPDGSVPVAPLAQPGSGIVMFSAILDDVNAKGGPGAGFALAD